VSRHLGSEAGFTLIELVVALALAGIVSLVLMQGVGLAGRGVERLSARVERLDQRRALEMLLRRAVGSAAAIPALDGKPGFAGTPTSLSFLSIAEDGGPGLYRVTLNFDANQPGRPLILTRQLSGTGSQRRDAGILAYGLRSFSLAYFGAASSDAKPSWQASWKDQSEPPDLVRILVDDGDGGDHPPIILRLRQRG
jgi:general secretion pathway protein J